MTRYAAPAHRPLRKAAHSRSIKLLAAGTLFVLGFAMVAVLALDKIGAPPRLLGPYLQGRSSGHNAWVEAVGRVLNETLVWLDRGALQPRLAWPAWLAAPASQTPPRGQRDILVIDVAQLRGALGAAQAGDVITLAPGRYRVDGAALSADRPGNADAPITVRAPRLGLVSLQFDMLEGFHVLAPHWTFENLVIEGVCAHHGNCEHAFHVVGAGASTIIRNNELRDFNAHIKVNGLRERYPDSGRIIDNRIYNTTPRRTDQPVTPIDLVAASDWTIQGNLIADFVKDDGDRTSYGVFAKGAGSGTRILGNVVLCEHRLRGSPGRRIGLSFGGGGSEPRACRDRRCVNEHDSGTMRDNLVASCSDAGMYLNRATNSLIEHNTLLDTAGLQTRAAGELLFNANLVDGPLRIDDASFVTQRDSRTTGLPALYLGLHPVRRLFHDADELDLAWAGSSPLLSNPHDTDVDLCGRLTGRRRAIGAFEDIARCQQRAATP